MGDAEYQSLNWPVSATIAVANKDAPRKRFEFHLQREEKAHIGAIG
jgi:hypothetical protein